MQRFWNLHIIEIIWYFFFSVEIFYSNFMGEEKWLEEFCFLADHPGSNLN